MELKNRKIDSYGQPLFVAEIGQNHNGNLETAKELILKAKQAGCDYAKFQCWNKDSLFIPSFYKDKDKPGDEFLGTKSLEETLDLLSLSFAQLSKIVEFCKEVGIGFVSTPTSNTYVDFLVDNDVDFIKVASFDLNNFDFLKYAASKKKPIVLSTGLSTIQEIDDALGAIYSTGNMDVVLMHCAAAYPPKDYNINLRNIDMLRDYFGIPVGYSDHSTGFSIGLAAIARGACVIEKHFTLDNTVLSGDHPLSANPEEMGILVNEGARIFNALGEYRRCLSEDDLLYKPILRRSIVSAVEMKEGEVITEEKVEFKRPGTGIQIHELHYLVNKRLKEDIDQNCLITWDLIE